MTGSLIWRAISEYLLVHQDIKRFRGHKNVIAVMAIDRSHPEFARAVELYSDFKDPDWVFVTEDHPRGPVHDRLKCDDTEFCFVVINKEGDVVMKESAAVPPSVLISRFEAKT